jgi:hypothetical protein
MKWTGEITSSQATNCVLATTAFPHTEWKSAADLRRICGPAAVHRQRNPRRFRLLSLSHRAVNEKESGKGEMAHTSDKKKDTRKTKPLEKTRRKRTGQEKPTGGKTGGGKKNTTSDRDQTQNQQKKKSIVAEMENNRLLNSKSVNKLLCYILCIGYI